jgi:hypothetical protein
MVERVHPIRRLLPATPLLPSDSREEFDRLLEAINQEIKPRGVMEEMHTVDIAYYAWWIQRMRRCKAGIISAEFRRALEDILDRLMQEPGDSRRVHIGNATRAEAENLAKEWFTDDGAKEQVLELFNQFQLDESAIEAVAVRRCAADLERIDRMLASFEARRQKALRQILEYRDDFARRLRDASNRIIEGKPLILEDSSKKDDDQNAPDNGN